MDYLGPGRVTLRKPPTRCSSAATWSPVMAGFTAVGMDVVQFGPIPTPAVALLAHSMRADLGVMGRRIVLYMAGLGSGNSLAIASREAMRYIDTPLDQSVEFLNKISPMSVP